MGKSQFDPQTYWENRLQSNFRLSGVGYMGLGARYNAWMYRVRRRVFRRAVELLPFNPRETDVLDIGSGTGFYIQQWKAWGVRTVAGLDLTSVSVENLKKSFPKDEFYQADIGRDISALPSRGGYHVATAFDVLFHIVDDQCYENAIRNVYRLLRPDGWFIFSDNFLHRGTVRAVSQVSRSLQDITAILQRTGFSIIRRLPAFVLMNCPVDQTSSLWKLGWETMARSVQRANALGDVWGAILYPWELLLTRILDEGPSTEVMVCKKKA